MLTLSKLLNVNMVETMVDKGVASKFVNIVDDAKLQLGKTKDKNGQYDPFFCAPGTDFWDKNYFDDDAMQPAGVVIVLQLIAYYDVYQMNISYEAE